MEKLYYRYYQRIVPKLEFSNYDTTQQIESPRPFNILPPIKSTPQKQLSSPQPDAQPDFMYTARTETQRTETQRTDTQPDFTLKTRSLYNDTTIVPPQSRLPQIQLPKSQYDTKSKLPVTQNNDYMKTQPFSETTNEQREKELKRQKRLKEMQQVVSQYKPRYDENPNEAPKETDKEDEDWYNEFKGSIKTPEEIAEDELKEKLRLDAERRRLTFERQGASKKLLKQK